MIRMFKITRLAYYESQLLSGLRTGALSTSKVNDVTAFHALGLVFQSTWPISVFCTYIIQKIFLTDGANNRHGGIIT